MKKPFLIISVIVLFAAVLVPVKESFAFNDYEHYFFGYYSSKSATSYALKYACSRNSDYYSFSSDCTNFVSQCLYAGYFIMSDTSSKKSSSSGKANAETSSWYHVKCTVPDKILGIQYGSHTEWKISTTWIRVSNNSSSSGYGLFQYLTKTRGFSSYTSTNAEEIIARARVGDVIQVAQYGETQKTHSVIVTEKTATDIKVTYHSNDKKNVSFISYFMPNWDRAGFPITLIQLNGIYQ